MIIHFNSYPGVGKLTIARELQSLIGGKILDNHSVYNVAFALTEPKTDAFYTALREVKAIAYKLVLQLPTSTPLILTNAHAADSSWGNESWDGVIALAKQRGSRLYNIVLYCDPDENDRRTQDPERDLLRKPRDPEMFPANRKGRELLSRGGDALLELDVTELSAKESALQIEAWLQSVGVAFQPNGNTNARL